MRAFPVPPGAVVDVRERRSGRWRRARWDPTGVTAVDGLPAVTGCWESREAESFSLPSEAVDGWRDAAPTARGGDATRKAAAASGG